MKTFKHVMKAVYDDPNVRKHGSNADIKAAKAKRKRKDTIKCAARYVCTS